MIYFIINSGTGNIKIGYTRDNPEKRLANLQTGCDAELRILNVVDGSTEKESMLHRKFDKNRIRGEWFKPSEEMFEYILGIDKKIERQIEKLNLCLVEYGFVGYCIKECYRPIQKNGEYVITKIFDHEAKEMSGSLYSIKKYVLKLFLTVYCNERVSYQEYQEKSL